ncbi:MAG: hypothetical protein LBW85_06450 [Deltaproteobacteria bacterium]|jgi:hypothetical protein|nr:hypothetical protein [Deltaproteobacteria bacterium]
MALVPAAKEDSGRLRELGVPGNVYPLDLAFGLDRLPHRATVAAMLEIARESTRRDSYEEAQKILKERTRIDCNDDAMRKITNAIGGIVFRNDMAAAESAWKKSFGSGTALVPEAKKNHTLYLEFGGAALPTRLGDGKHGTVYRENKSCMAFSTAGMIWLTDENGGRRPSITSREYAGYLGGAEEFAKLAYSLALKNGYGRYLNTVVISDGAAWVRDLKELLFPEAQQILNFFQLEEHIIDYAKIIFNKNKGKYIPWSENISRLFKSSETEKAINLIEKSKNNKYLINSGKLMEYINYNFKNIDYAEYSANGYVIGSEAIEGSNKAVVNRRLKYGAMRWNVESAQAVLSLMAKARSGLWESEVARAAYVEFGEPMPRALDLTA